MSKNQPQHIKTRIAKEDPELILENELSKRFGDRYRKYRDDYNSIISDPEHKLFLNYPLTVSLELINRCDLECVACYQGFRNDAKQAIIDDKILDKMFLDFKKNKLPALMISQSEPLLYKNIEKVLKKAKEAEIMDVFIFTNGTLLNEKACKMILESSVTKLFVSIDAATEKTFASVRIPVSKRLLNEDRLEKLENNVKRFIKMRNELNRKTPVVRVSFVDLKENHHEVEAFKEKWKDIVDLVEVQKETSMKFYDKLKKENIHLLEEKSLKKYNCDKPWGEISIYSDGSISPCCNLTGKKIPIGNIKDSTIKEMWDGVKMNAVREGLMKNTPIKVCQACIESQETR